MRHHIRQLGDNAVNQSRLYVTHNDIMGQPCFGNDIIFAVKAPRGTTLEVPNPDALTRSDQKYKVLLKSKGAPFPLSSRQPSCRGKFSGQTALSTYTNGLFSSYSDALPCYKAPDHPQILSWTFVRFPSSLCASASDHLNDPSKVSAFFITICASC